MSLSKPLLPLLKTQTFVERLTGAGVLIPSVVAGVYGHGERFSFVIEGLARAIDRLFGADTERMRFPPVMPRSDLQRIGYFRNFPHLLGTIHCFCGDEASHREMLKRHDADEDWTDAQAPSDLVLTPAACYPVYFALAERGPAPPDGHSVQVRSHCFRREPSEEPVRMQSFQMHEFVRVGSPEQVQAFRDRWMAEAPQLFATLGLTAQIAVANDPFFGRAAVVMAKGQRAEHLKYELQTPISDDGEPTACMSFNYHLDHFGIALGLRRSGGEVAHTACIGFGLERIALALLRRHGLDPKAWPADLVQLLGG